MIELLSIYPDPNESMFYFFEKVVDRHSLCPNDLLYLSNALAGESGEVANVVKKIQMAIKKPQWVTANGGKLSTIEEFREKLNDELSDLLFYVQSVAKCNGVTLDSLMKLQASKLAEQSKEYDRIFLK